MLRSSTQSRMSLIPQTLLTGNKLDGKHIILQVGADVNNPVGYVTFIDDSQVNTVVKDRAFATVFKLVGDQRFPGLANGQQQYRLVAPSNLPSVYSICSSTPASTYALSRDPVLGTYPLDSLFTFTPLPATGTSVGALTGYSIPEVNGVGKGPKPELYYYEPNLHKILNDGLQTSFTTNNIVVPLLVSGSVPAPPVPTKIAAPVTTDTIPASQSKPTAVRAAEINRHGNHKAHHKESLAGATVLTPDSTTIDNGSAAGGIVACLVIIAIVGGLWYWYMKSPSSMAMDPSSQYDDNETSNLVGTNGRVLYPQAPLGNNRGQQPPAYAPVNMAHAVTSNNSRVIHPTGQPNHNHNRNHNHNHNGAATVASAPNTSVRAPNVRPA